MKYLMQGFMLLLGVSAVLFLVTLMAALHHQSNQREFDLKALELGYVQTVVDDQVCWVRDKDKTDGE